MVGSVARAIAKHNVIALQHTKDMASPFPTCNRSIERAWRQQSKKSRNVLGCGKLEAVAPEEVRHLARVQQVQGS